MNSEIKNIEDVELSKQDIREMTSPNSPNVIDYIELQRIGNLDAVFKNGGCILLIDTSITADAKTGHWVLLLHQGGKNIEHFDSYGFGIDKELDIANRDLLRYGGGNQLTPHLTALIQKDGYNVIENNHKLQILKDGINTCGRHCVVRYLMRDTPLNDYIKMMTGNKINADEIVSYMTYLL